MAACTPEHARLLKRYTSDVVICFDADAAGFKAADKAFAILAPEGMHIRMVIMPPSDDPDSLIKRDGSDTFKALVEDAREYFHVKLEHESSMRDLSSIRERTALARELANLIAYVGDKLTKDALINQVATRLGIGAEEMRGSVVEAEKQRARGKFFEQRQANAQNKNNTGAITKPSATAMNGSIAYLCHLALSSQEAQDWLGEQLETIADPLSSLSGGSILRDILAKLPDPKNAAAIQTYLTSLEPDDQQALRNSLAQDTPNSPVRAAEETTAMLVNTHFQNKEAAVRARLRQPDLGPEQMVALMNEAKELQDVLKNLQQRFIR